MLLSGPYEEISQNNHEFRELKHVSNNFAIELGYSLDPHPAFILSLRRDHIINNVTTT